MNEYITLRSNNVLKLMYWFLKLVCKANTNSRCDMPFSWVLL